MQQVGRHCPFLNRADSRCAAHFNLDGLRQAYGICFDRYKTCPVYLELLIERRARRSGAAESLREDANNPIVTVTVSAGKRTPMARAA
jgi:hypothetical protein